MNLVVKKYGGTSVASIAKISKIAENLIEEYNSKKRLVVVLSAMGNSTDKLVNLSSRVSKNPNTRDFDMLLSSGEQVSVSLLSMILNERGIAAKSYTGWQAGIKTNIDYNTARILSIDTKRIRAELKKGFIVVVAGFQGINNRGDITTLGRGGSDTTAVALAAALKAQECQIHTDVDGVYTTDPRICAKAKRIDVLTYEEMLEMAGLGSRVLQLRSVEFASKYNVPLRVLKYGRGAYIRYCIHKRRI